MANEVGRTGSDDFVETPGQDWVAKTELTPGAVGLSGAIMQNVTHIAPAIAAFFFTQTIVSFAGGHAPLAYLIGFPGRARDVPGPAGQAVPVGGRLLHLRQPHHGRYPRQAGPLRLVLAHRRWPGACLPRLHIPGRVPEQPITGPGSTGGCWLSSAAAHRGLPGTWVSPCRCGRSSLSGRWSS